MERRIKFSMKTQDKNLTMVPISCVGIKRDSNILSFEKIKAFHYPYWVQQDYAAVLTSTHGSYTDAKQCT